MWRKLWRLLVYPKVKFFRLCWRTFLDRTGIHMDRRCPMCEMSNENNQPFIEGVPLHGGVLASGSSSASATKTNMASTALVRYIIL
ncbi:hypothetical protein QJS04_geneDACA010234 [Acorus gramineus]|uniref:Uncharacterized protein n=1 Tax=Acorus gramineus TaxID=55184 RepID=A0AAV9A5D0_ACOGR|nr:hypothetical protein QJS04_geneDACA010234 [Acorus gramineus]